MLVAHLKSRIAHLRFVLQIITFLFQKCTKNIFSKSHARQIISLDTITDSGGAHVAPLPAEFPLTFPRFPFQAIKAGGWLCAGGGGVIN
jgi:hypothetical protein